MSTISLCLAGDVMTGRGIDQVQAHPSVPVLHERVVRDARDYVRLAEHVNGPVPAPVAPAYVWGDALAEMEQRQPDLRLVNLETAITTSERAWPDKAVHYRMHPDNIACLMAARIDFCALANNHVLDWGHAGMVQTLKTLREAGIHCAGAGSHAQAAAAPACLPLPGGRHLLVFSWATPDSGVPFEWTATTEHPGVAMLYDLTETSAQQVAQKVARHRKRSDRVMVSLHWGGNWGVEVPDRHRFFAQRLIELGAADLVHGHSSHHPRPMEVYRGKLILYGCGDLINDYEGIASQEMFDPSAVCLYFATLSGQTGELQQLEIVPMQLRRLQLIQASRTARQSLQSLFATGEQRFHTSLQAQPGGSWQLRW